MVFSSMVVLVLAMILRPWKLNIYKESEMEVGLFTMCRVTPKVYRCYDNWYNDHPICESM